MMASSSIRGYSTAPSPSMNNSNPSISITNTTSNTNSNSNIAYSSSMSNSSSSLGLPSTSYVSRQQITPPNSRSRESFPTGSESDRAIASYTATLDDDTDLLTTLATVSVAQTSSMSRISNSNGSSTTSTNGTNHDSHNSVMQTEQPSSLSLSPPSSYRAHTKKNGGNIYTTYNLPNNLTNHHAHSHSHHSMSSVSNSSHPTPPASAAMSSTRDDASSSAMNSNVSVKRQRTGRACDACRRRKVRCDGAVPHCSNCRTANVSCTFLDAAKKRGPPKGYIEAIESRLHRMESLIGGMAQTDTRVTSASVVTDDYTSPSGQYPTTYREAAVYGGMSTVLNHHLIENVTTTTTNQALSSRTMPPPPSPHDTISGTPSLLAHPTSTAASTTTASRPNSHGNTGNNGVAYAASPLHSRGNVNTISESLSPSLMATLPSPTDLSRINGGLTLTSTNGTNGSTSSNYKDHKLSSLESPTDHIMNDPYAVSTNDNDPTLAGIMAAVSSLAKEQQEQRQQQLQNTATIGGSVNGAMRGNSSTSNNSTCNNTKLYGYRGGYPSSDMPRTMPPPTLTTFSYACDADASVMASSQVLPRSFAASTGNHQPPPPPPPPQSSTSPLIPRMVSTMSDNLNGATGKKEIDMNELPDALTSGRLISIFRERIHPYLPILHWRRFLDCLASASPPKLLLNAVYAYASRYDMDTSPNPLSTSTSQSPGEIYVLRAQKLLDTRVSDPDLESVQALLLLSSYLLSVKRIALGHMYSGMAVSLAQQLQLYNDSTKDRIERADHLRTWWGLLASDRLIATTFFHPLSIDEKDCCPPNLGEINIECGTTGDDEPFASTDLYFASLARLSVLYGRALRLVKARLIDGKPPVELKNEIATLDRDLSQWWRTIPEMYRFDPMEESIWQAPKNRLPAIAMLACLYHMAVIMVHRPWGPIDGTKQPWMPHARSERLCLASAHTIACICHRMQHHEAPNIYGIFPATAFAALMILIPVATHHPDMEIQRFARRDVVRIRSLLRASTRTISITKDALSSVEDLCSLRGISLHDIEEMAQRQRSNRSDWGNAISTNNGISLDDTTIQQRLIENNRRKEEGGRGADDMALVVVVNNTGPPASLSNLLNPEPSQHNGNGNNGNGNAEHYHQQQQYYHPHHSAMAIRSPKRQRSYEDQDESARLPSSLLLSHRGVTISEELAESASTTSSSSGFTVPGSLHAVSPLDEKLLQEEIAEEQAWLNRLCPRDDGYLFPLLTAISTRKEKVERTDTCTTSATLFDDAIREERALDNDLKNGHNLSPSTSLPCLCNRSSDYLHDYTPVYVKDLYYWRVPISMMAKRWPQFMEYYAKIPELERQSKVPFL